MLPLQGNEPPRHGFAVSPQRCRLRRHIEGNLLKCVIGFAVRRFFNAFMMRANDIRPYKNTEDGNAAMKVQNRQILTRVLGAGTAHRHHVGDIVDLLYNS